MNSSHTIYIFEHAQRDRIKGIQSFPPTYFIDSSLIIPSIELSYCQAIPPLTNVRVVRTQYSEVVAYWADFGRGTELFVGTSKPIVVHSTKEHL